jgi:hypothetical protein
MESTSLTQRARMAGRAALFLLVAVTVIAAPQEDRALFGEIDTIMQGLSEITGWSVKRHVPADFISKDRLREYLEKRIKEEVNPKDIRLEELALKMFGLVPNDFDLKTTTINLLSEQAAAFYDPRKRRLSIIETSGESDMEKRAALIHELAHALADQHFRLERYIRKENNDDGASARQAVVEGQATWLMWAYVNREGGGEAGVRDSAMAAMDEMSETTSAQYPALAGAPLYVRESLLFPYTKGLAFQDGVFQHERQAAFSEVFQRPPTSTREILHPAVYLEHVHFQVPKPPRIPDERRYHKLADGTLGEFDEYVLLRQYGKEPDARRISSKWRGGVFRLLETKHGHNPLLACTTVWYTPESASEYFEAYQAVLKGKWKKYEVTGSTATKVTGVGDRGAFILQRDQDRVTSVEGLPEPAIN